MSSKCSFTCICGIVLPLNPSATTVCARYTFYPNLRFTFSLQSAFYTLSAFYPWSAVCSLQSAVRSLRFTLTDISICLLNVLLRVKYPEKKKNGDCQVHPRNTVKSIFHFKFGTSNPQKISLSEHLLRTIECRNLGAHHDAW